MSSSSAPIAVNDDERKTDSSSPVITNASTQSTANAANENSAGAVQVQAVSNPYATKKSGPQLSMKPLHEATAVTTTTAPATTAAVLEAPPITTTPALELSTKDNDADENNTIVQDHPVSTISEKEAVTTATTDTVVATVSTSGGINMPMWQRLPSRNLSFQSAEILTVTECLQHTNLSSYLDRSVRLTGSILERFVHSNSDNAMNNTDTNMVSLVLSDPLAALPPTRKNALRRRSTSLGGSTCTVTTAANRRVSFPKTPTALNKVKQPGSSGNTLTKQTRPPGTHTRTILRRKSGGLLSGGSTAAKPGLATPATSSRKRNLSGAFNPTTPEDALVQTLASSSASSSSSSNNCLWVLVNPQHVSVTHSTTGDLVMAMGEIREYKPEDSDLPSTIHKIAARIRASQQQQQAGRKPVPGQEESANQQQDPTFRPIYFLQTRILRNANGTNMKLHTEALYARRQQLVAARSQQPVDQDDASASCAVWPGCGPPPYNSNESKS
jgi:hypothetical protein